VSGSVLPERLQHLLQLDSDARQAVSPEALRYIIVNRTRLLVEYRQALLLDWRPGGLRVNTVSDVSAPDDNAPYIRWINRFAKHHVRSEQSRKIHGIPATNIAHDSFTDWKEWAASHFVWIPLRHGTGDRQPYLLLVRDEPWKEEDTPLVQRLSETYAHALWAHRRKQWQQPFTVQRRILLAAMLVLLACLFIPVRQSVLAPAELVARKPWVVSAPLDGVVEKFHVEPSQEVCEGQPLFSFNDTALRNEFRVASEELSVAEASLRKARQGGFHDADQRSRIALMSAGRDISAARRDYARELLDRIQVVAGRDGVAVFDDPNDWIGRPVQTGERIMLIADPHDTELHIDLPVKDAMILSSGARVLLYLDVDPVNAVQARLERVSYEAAPSVNKILSYRTVAQFIGPPESRPRLGLHGVAKIVGDKVPLGMYLFRRPFSVVRQRLGLW
jgi:hypothetical protein